MSDEPPVAPEDECARRLGVVEAIRAGGGDPYPVRFDRDRTAQSLHDEFGALEPGSETGVAVRLAGRLLLIRRQGKLVFATLRDGTAAIQLFVSQGEVGEEGLAEFARLDLGDRVGVEGAVMTTRPGGAAARAFVTHHNALDMDLFLRIAPELYLKRLIVAGFERVYEIGRVFRNEGLSTRHNPEFTMLEAYQAFADYTDMMTLTEELVAHAAREATGTTVVPGAPGADGTPDGQPIDLTPPWPRRTLRELVAGNAGVDVHPSMPLG